MCSGNCKLRDDPRQQTEGKIAGWLGVLSLLLAGELVES